MSSLSLYLDTPTPIFKARINQTGTITYPVTELTFDTVTLGAYTDIQVDQTLWLGTAEGLDDLGRVRVQNLATSTTIPVGRVSEGYENGQLAVQDNAFITVFDNYEVWAKPPYIVDNKTQYKDSNIAVGTYTTNEPPVANCGPGTAATIDPDTEVITVFFTGVNSLAIADGASISSYAWDVKDGTVTSGALDEMEVTATFPAGKRWVALTVTDSNGLSHTARCPVVAVDPANDVRIQVFNATLSESYAGRTWDIEIKQAIPQATYPDGCLVMIWQGEPISSSDRTHMRLIGWHQSDDASTRSSRTGNIRSTTLHAVDVAGRLATLPGFSQEVDKADTPDNWSEMTSPTVFKYLHYLLLWHSTALALADYLPDGKGSDYPFVTFASDGASLYEQVNSLAKKILPDHLLTCNQQGQLRIWPDPQLQDPADRTIAVQGSLIESLMQEVSFGYSRPPKVHWLIGYAFLTQSDYTKIDGVDTLLTVQCKAPGTAPGQGLELQETTQGIAKSQAALNSVTGHRFARMNARFGPVNVTLTDDSGSSLEAARLEWVTLTLSPANAAQRGLSFATVRTLIKSVNRRYEARRTGTRQSASYQLEIETAGKPALTVIPNGQTYNTEPIPAIPGIGLPTGQDQVAAIGKFKVYRTSDFTTPSGSGGPTWDAKDLTGSDEMLTWVVDPFSPGYIVGTGAINGWAASATKLYRLTDLFGATPAATAVITFATTALWRTVQASFGTYFVGGNNPWLICVSYYGASGGTKATYSVDGGATWAAEVVVSAEYDSGGASNPIGLYCSPKTPGLAYTAAHIETANPAATSGYVSHDWGATWTAMVGDDPAAPLPYWGHLTGGVCTAIARPRFAYSVTCAAPSGTTTDDGQRYFLIAPPTNAVRMKIEGSWLESRTCVGGSVFGVAYNGSIGNFIGTGANFSVGTDTLSKSTGATPNGSNLGQDFVIEWHRSPGETDWEKSRDDLLAVSPTTTDGYAYIAFHASATGALGRTATETLSFTATVTEIELEDSTVYVPTTSVIQTINGQGGEIHLPWPDNADESVFYYGSLDRSGSPVIGLQRADAGTVTDISQSTYGVNSGHFAIRTFDGDRSFALLAGESGAGNSGVWVSDDEGDTWTEIVTPSAVTPYQAAFGGDSEEIIYIWGPAETISYSDDFGATIDDRSGNLGALSATKLIGIAGGPTG